MDDFVLDGVDGVALPASQEVPTPLTTDVIDYSYKIYESNVVICVLLASILVFLFLKSILFRR